MGTPATVLYVVLYRDTLVVVPVPGYRQAIVEVSPILHRPDHLRFVTVEIDLGLWTW
jgi:hypothetical protein